ncbi:MAG: hypothetical protein HYX48_04205 [Chlamydiales bacterium]|nr:hypothetical protein [Chlamydiales bacterium]
MSSVQLAQFRGLPDDLVQAVLFNMLTTEELAKFSQTNRLICKLFRGVKERLEREILRDDLLSPSCLKAALLIIPREMVLQRWCEQQLSRVNRDVAGPRELALLKQKPEWQKFSVARFEAIYTLGVAIEDRVFLAFIKTLRYLIPIPRNLYVNGLRAWFKSDESREIRSRVQSLAYRAELPPEVCELRELRYLGFKHTGAAPSSLPDGFGQLVNLTRLDVLDADYAEIPSVIESLPQLSHLEISSRKSPVNRIGVLPDALARRVQTNSIYVLLREFANKTCNNILEFDHMKDGALYDHYLGIKRTELHQIPFFLWFRENFSLPYIPSLVFVGLIQMVFQELEQCLFEEESMFITTPAALSMILTFLATSIPLLILNLPILAFNILLDQVIEPVVTYFRDRLGYSRMVAV